MRKGERQVLLNAVTANTASAVFDCDEYDNVTFTIIGDDSPEGVIKAVGLNDPANEPDFSSAASKSNPWIYKGGNDEDSKSTVRGSTGYTFSGSNAIYELNLSTENMAYCGVILSSYVAGNFTVIARGIRKVR